MNRYKKLLKSVLAKFGRQLNQDVQQDQFTAKSELLQVSQDLRAELQSVRELAQRELSGLEQICRQSQQLSRAHAESAVIAFREVATSSTREILQQCRDIKSEIEAIRELSRRQSGEHVGSNGQTQSGQVRTVANAEVDLSTACSSAGDLFALFTEVTRHQALWAGCDMLLTCASSHAGAQRLFPNQEVIQLEDHRDFNRTLAGKKHRRIGLLSPWLMRTLEFHPEVLLTLLRSCRELILVSRHGTGQDNIRLRKMLHRTGFYEVVVPTEDGGFDFSTVGFGPDGQFSVRGSQPGLFADPDGWGTYLACRLPLVAGTRMIWRNVTGSYLLASGEGRFSTGAGELSLAVTQPDEQTVPRQIKINGTMHWTESSRGHAALVACYAGPGDSHMYAALMEGGSRSVAIWHSSDEWVRLAAVEIPEKFVRVEPSSCSLPLWLRVDQDAISVGSGETCFHTEKHQGLARSSSVGVRIADDSIFVSDISVNLNTAAR